MVRRLGLMALSLLLVAAVVLVGRPTVSDLSAQQTAGGVTYVSKGYVLGRGEWKTFRAPCPSGRHVLGGGHLNGGGLADVIGAHSYPYDGADRDGRPDDGWAALLGGFK